MYLPPEFISTITKIWGQPGTTWLANLPKLIDECTQRWCLSNLETANNLSHNYVGRAWSWHHKTDVVLKISMLSNEFLQELVALRYYSGNGCVQLLQYDVSMGAMLLERVYPGTTLKDFFPHDDALAVEHTISVIKKLHANPLTNDTIHPSINEWLALLYDFSKLKIPASYLDKARTLADALLESQPPERYLLHADLHHENILFDNLRGWLAIDPKGIVGELGFEIGAFIRNPIKELAQHPEAHNILTRRFDLFSAGLQIDRQRLVDWSYVQAVLAACWALDDGNDIWEKLLECADLIEKCN